MGVGWVSEAAECGAAGPLFQGLGQECAQRQVVGSSCAPALASSFPGPAAQADPSVIPSAPSWVPAQLLLYPDPMLLGSSPKPLCCAGWKGLVHK